MNDVVQGSVEGRSFTRCSQWLACLMVLAVFWQGWLALQRQAQWAHRGLFSAPAIRPQDFRRWRGSCHGA